MVYCTCIYSCVLLKLGEGIYMAMDLIPILLGSLPLAHNAQHSLVLGNNWASGSVVVQLGCAVCIYIYVYIRYVYQIPLISKCLYVNLLTTSMLQIQTGEQSVAESVALLKVLSRGRRE